MNTFQQQQHTFQQQQLRDMQQQQRRHGVAESSANDAEVAIAAHRAASALIHAEYEQRSAWMDQEFEERCAAMRSEHDARVAALRAAHAAPRSLDGIETVDDVRAYFARNR